MKSFLIFYLKSIYSQIPKFIIRGKVYREYFKFLKMTEDWVKEDIDKFRLKEIEQLEKKLVNNTPYYKSFDFNCGFTDKNTLLKHTKSLLSTSESIDRMIPCTTGGSTGIPTHFYLSDSSIKKNQAFVDYILDKYGVSYKKIPRKVVFRGDVLPCDKNVMKVAKTYYFSSFDLDLSALNSYRIALEYFSPEIIHAFPSSLLVLVNYLINENHLNRVQFDSVKTVLLSSEVCDDRQKLKILKVFPKATIIDFYSNSEQTILGYKVNFDKGIFPFQYGQVDVKKEELYSTSYLEKDYALFNYKTGDVVAGLKESERGELLYDRIIGRTQTFLEGSQGEVVSIASLNMHNKGFENVNAFQYYQPRKGIVVVNLMCNHISDIEFLYIEEYFKAKLIGFKVSARLVKEMIRTPSGKEAIVIKDF